MGAQVITDWTDPDGKELAGRITRGHVEELVYRLNQAIATATAKVNDLQAEVAKLQGTIAGMRDARKGLEPLVSATQHLDAIETILRELPTGVAAKKGFQG